MNKLKTRANKLYKYYEKELARLHNSAFELPENPMDYFVTYLRYLRDYSILTDETPDLTTNVRITSISLAVNEYELYNDCIAMFYDISNKNVATRLDNSKSAEEVAAEYQTERTKHWNRFWEIVSTNIRDWFNDELSI